MIHLKANAVGKTKREYIEDVIDDCKLIFNAAFADQFFHDDNLKVAFCTLCRSGKCKRLLFRLSS